MTARRTRERGWLPLPFPADARFYRSLQACLGDLGAVRLALVEDRVVGFLVHLYGHDTLFMKFIGLDDETSLRTRACFRLFHEAVEQACHLSTWAPPRRT